MRILTRLPHPTFQITIFSNDGRFPVQFEHGGLSQIYRFRRSEAIAGADDIKRLIDADFLAGVAQQFAAMRALHSRALATFAPPDQPPGSELPDII